MIILVILSSLLSFVITSPIPRKDLTLFPEFTIEILKQIHKVNCDGSYSFGFKASDGTFLVEHKDADGYVTGEFGYANPQFQLSEYISGFNLARQLNGFPFPATDNKACENRTTSSVFKILEDTPIEVKEPTVQKALAPEIEKQKTISPDRPTFFKFGEAIFRSPSNVSESKMLSPNSSRIDQFIWDLKSRKLFPTEEKITH